MTEPNTSTICSEPDTTLAGNCSDDDIKPTGNCSDELKIPVPANTCTEPLTKPAGKFAKLSKSTCSEPEITSSPPGLSTEPLTIPSPKSVAYLLSKSECNCADDDIIPAGSCSEDERIPVLPKT